MVRQHLASQSERDYHPGRIDEIADLPRALSGAFARPELADPMTTADRA